MLKALTRKAEILVLDEPTAVLTSKEVDKLFELILDLVAWRSYTTSFRLVQYRWIHAHGKLVTDF